MNPIYTPSSPTRTPWSLIALLSLLVRQDREECPRQLLLSHSKVLMTALDGVNGTVCNAQQYQQSLQSYNSRSPTISCLTHGDSIGLAVSIEHICFRLDSELTQLYSLQPKHRSSVAFVSPSHLSGLAYVRLPFTRLSRLTRMLHSGTYNGTGGTSQMVTGGCSRGLLTSTWSA